MILSVFLVFDNCRQQNFDNSKVPRNRKRNIHPAEDIGSINNMHIWRLDNWEKILPKDGSWRTGLRFRCDKNVDPEVKRACLQFGKWLRAEYYFPVRIVVYVKEAERIRAKDGDHVVGTFFEPYSYYDEPYIRIATGDYEELLSKNGKDNALASILISLAHELTHYYQWINNLQLTSMGRERQASRYARYIIDEYATTREHP